MSGKMITDPTCTICRTEPEDGFHATVQCTKERALRSRLRSTWKLPPDRNLINSGTDWTLVTVGSVDEITRSKLILCGVEPGTFGMMSFLEMEKRR
jgi:hypothetical protein